MQQCEYAHKCAIFPQPIPIYLEGGWMIRKKKSYNNKPYHPCVFFLQKAKILFYVQYSDSQCIYQIHIQDNKDQLSLYVQLIMKFFSFFTPQNILIVFQLCCLSILDYRSTLHPCLDVVGSSYQPHLLYLILSSYFIHLPGIFYNLNDACFLFNFLNVLEALP